MTEVRPSLTADISGAELQRWYWLKSELVDFARTLGIAPSGGKQELTARIVARLDGRALPASGPRRPAAADRLPEPLGPTTRIPSGQRCTQQLRGYFLDAIGPGFRFDAPMREFIAEGQGRTLAAAVEHWHATRTRRSPEIGAQFEFNQFVSRWHRHHPDGSREEALTAWRAHRATPVDAREPHPPR